MGHTIAAGTSDAEAGAADATAAGPTIDELTANPVPANSSDPRTAARALVVVVVSLLLLGPLARGREPTGPPRVTR